MEQVAQEVGREFDGKLDVLVNNAGYLSAWLAIGDSDPEDWWQDLGSQCEGVVSRDEGVSPACAGICVQDRR